MTIGLGPMVMDALATTGRRSDRLLRSATLIFERIECWYDPRRRHSYGDGFSPIDCESAAAVSCARDAPLQLSAASRYRSRWDSHLVNALRTIAMMP
jgi:hypothetical protein